MRLATSARVLRRLGLVLALLATPAFAQQAQLVEPSPAMPTEAPAPGRPEVQSAAPEVGAGRGAERGVPQQAAQPPDSTVAPQPTGQAPAPSGAAAPQESAPPASAAPPANAPAPAMPPVDATMPQASSPPSTAPAGSAAPQESAPAGSTANPDPAPPAPAASPAPETASPPAPAASPAPGAASPAAAPAAPQPPAPVDPSPAMPNRAAPAGSPEVQSAAPEVGLGRGAAPGTPQQNAQTPASTEAPRPTGTPTAPPPVAAAPTPVAPVAAPPPLTARNQISAEELELQRTLQGGRIEGRITIPNSTAAVLVQPEGRSWRQFHNVTLAWVGGIAVGGMLLLLGLFYLFRGRIVLEGGVSGRTIQRFNWLERGNHWMVASTFIILGLSGLNLTFGRYALLPIFGPEAYYALTHYGKIAHNFLAFPFSLGLVLMLLLWVRDNIPDRTDVEWIKQAGGFLGSGHPPARRFNAGQKVVFWITVLGGGLVAVSGYFLIFPFWGTDIDQMQWAHIIHSLLSVLMIAAMLAHIYIGSIGMEGAYDAMGSGQVDLNWARSHHGLWVEEEMAKARQVVAPSAGPPGARMAGD